MTRNRSIDAVRAAACVFVLFVHAYFPNPFGLYVSGLARSAVPFFLMVSGYFACRPDAEATLAAARRRLASTARLTLAGVLLYAVSNTACRLLTGQRAFSWLDSLLTAEGLFNFVVYNRAVFLSSVMYYLFMMLYVYALFMLIVKSGWLKAARRMIPLLLAACVILDEFCGQPWYYAGNFLLTGLPFFLLGHLFAERPPRLAHPGRLLLPGLLLTIAEIALFGDAYCYIGTLVFTVSLFAVCLQNPGERLPEGLVRFGRNCSMIVFLIHCAVRDWLYLVIPQSPAVFAWLRPIAVLLVTVALSLLIARRKARKTPVHSS